MTTDPTATPEARTRAATLGQRNAGWGGARPGAGAPRNNHNAARRTPREDLARVAASPGFRESLRHLPPALGELLVIALGAAGEHAIRTVEAEAAAACLSAEESDRAQRRATMIARSSCSPTSATATPSAPAAARPGARPPPSTSSAPGSATRSVPTRQRRFKSIKI